MSMDKTRLANTALAAMAADGMSDADAPQVFRAGKASAARVLAEALAAGVVTEVEEHYSGGGTPGTTTGTAVKQFTIGDGSAKLITIAHNLGTQTIVDVTLKRISDNAQCAAGWIATDANNVRLSFGVPPAASSLVASILYIAP